MKSSQIEKYYRDCRANFDDAIQAAMRISVGAGGVPSEHGRQFWSSLLFTKLLVTCMSVKRLCPRRIPTPDKTHWDFSSVASLVRDIAECHITFFYLCVDEMQDEEEWQVRQNLLFVRDNRARYRMLSDFGADPDDETYRERQAELRQRLEGFPSFMNLPDKKREELLRGDKSPYIQDEMLEKMGVDQKIFRGFYRFFSAHVHTGPISFMRMAEHGRGNGEENDYDKSNIAGALEFATGILTNATEQMLKLHPVAADRGGMLLSGNRQDYRAKKEHKKR